MNTIGFLLGSMKDNLNKGWEITYKGMIAILVVLLVAMLVTFVMNIISHKLQENKERKMIEKETKAAEFDKK
jgi:uncharacterized membrane protein